MNSLILYILTVVSWFLVGFGVRGLLEYYRNKNVEGWKSIWMK